MVTPDIQTKGEIVDEIVIDANMDLQWPHRTSLMPPSPTCSTQTLHRVGLCPESTLYLVDRVYVPTSLDLEAFACCLMDIVDDMANSVNDQGNDLQQLEGMQTLNMVES